jgi:hypothetical protein
MGGDRSLMYNGRSFVPTIKTWECDLVKLGLDVAASPKTPKHKKNLTLHQSRQFSQ